VRALLVALFCFFAGSYMLWEWWIGDDSQLPLLGILCPKGQASLWLKFSLGILAGITGLVLFGLHLTRLRAQERLAVGRDRLQIIRRRQGHDFICTQVPFANIAQCVYKVEKGATPISPSSHRICILLADPSDPASWVENANPEVNKRVYGWHLIIEEGIMEGGYRTRLEVIHEKLVEKINQHTGTSIPSL
jgi:hypothetical protein